METVNQSSKEVILKSDKYLQRFTINEYLNDVICKWFIFEKNIYYEEQLNNNIKVEDSISLDKIESIWDFCSLHLLLDLPAIIKDKYSICNDDYIIDNAILLEIDAFATIDMKDLNIKNSDFIFSVSLDNSKAKIIFADGIIMDQTMGLLTLQTNKTQLNIHTIEQNSYMLFVFISNK